MKLSRQARIDLKKRYLTKDSDGFILETPEQMFRRVAKAIAEPEHNYSSSSEIWDNFFYSLMSHLRFLPNSPTLMNAGRETGQLAACFVLPIFDSINSIFDYLRNSALILQSGGGTVFSFSHLRPTRDIVSSTCGIASGPGSFMKIYNSVTEVIKQGGRGEGLAWAF